jgi:hypothetical protein
MKRGGFIVWPAAKLLQKRLGSPAGWQVEEFAYLRQRKDALTITL